MSYYATIDDMILLPIVKKRRETNNTGKIGLTYFPIIKEKSSTVVKIS